MCLLCFFGRGCWVGVKRKKEKSTVHSSQMWPDLCSISACTFYYYKYELILLARAGNWWQYHKGTQNFVKHGAENGTKQDYHGRCGTVPATGHHPSKYLSKKMCRAAGGANKHNFWMARVKLIKIIYSETWRWELSIGIYMSWVREGGGGGPPMWF